MDKLIRRVVVVKAALKGVIGIESNADVTSRPCEPDEVIEIRKLRLRSVRKLHRLRGLQSGVDLTVIFIDQAIGPDSGTSRDKEVGTSWKSN